MADQNRDRNVGGSSQQSGGGSPKDDQQSDLDRPERMPEQIKGDQTGSESQRPPRQPGRMPLPD
jgi:hypothetical protein